MKTATLLLVVPLLAFRVYAADADVETGLAAVTDLGLANGQALACKENSAAGRAKALMLRYAPRTSRFGDAFEQATQQGFLGQVKAATPCPEAQAFADRIDGIAARLHQSLPVQPEAK